MPMDSGDHKLVMQECDAIRDILYKLLQEQSRTNDILIELATYAKMEQERQIKAGTQL